MTGAIKTGISGERKSGCARALINLQRSLNAAETLRSYSARIPSRKNIYDENTSKHLLKLFEQKILPDQVYPLSALLLVLGCLRTASVLVYQREKWLLAKKRMRRLRQPPPDPLYKPEKHSSGGHA